MAERETRSLTFRIREHEYVIREVDVREDECDMQAVVTELECVIVFRIVQAKMSSVNCNATPIHHF